jgi:signal transduction histidine kinase
MNQIFDAVSAHGQDALLSPLDLTPPQIREPNASSLEELAHELRQPLGVIESIAYFLEITTDNEQLSGHMQRIQAMVLQVNRILDGALGGETEKAIGAAAC